MSKQTNKEWEYITDVVLKWRDSGQPIDELVRSLANREERVVKQAQIEAIKIGRRLQVLESMIDDEIVWDEDLQKEYDSFTKFEQELNKLKKE